MDNPLENSMKHAENKMLIENMREGMAAQLECAIMVAKLKAAHFNALMAGGVDRESAAIITAHYLNGTSSE